MSGEEILKMENPREAKAKLGAKLAEERNKHPERFRPVLGHVTSIDLEKSRENEKRSTQAGHIGEALDKLDE